MNVNFELYKVFYHVARNLSFSDAAAKLYISQSAVSQSIKLLEEQLGTKLFLRSTKKVRLTPDGDVLYKHVEQAFNFIKTGERSIHEIHALKKGELRIGASDTICRHYLLPYLQQFHQSYPQVKINITNRPSPVCVELLEKGRTDMAVAHLSDAGEYNHMTVRHLTTVEDVFIAGSAFARLRGRPLALKELAALPLLMLEPHTVARSVLDDVTAGHGFELVPEIELGSIDLLIDLVKIGLGISFVSREYIEKELASGELFTLNVAFDSVPRSLGIITHNRLPVPVAAQKFIELLLSGRR
jgi:DNA-binding transcriptional LysR family regulator